VKTVGEYGKKIQAVTGAINTCKNTIQKLTQQGKDITQNITNIKNSVTNCKTELQGKEKDKAKNDANLKKEEGVMKQKKDE
jgi:septal ring factor EnvC (AmiA/AmiB activator)